MKTLPKETSQPKAHTPQISKPKKMRDVYIKIHNASNTMHTDQTCCFQATSSAENKYIMRLLEVDGIYIDTEPMKNRSTGSIVKAYLALWNHLTATGIIKPTSHLLNNKASAELKAKIKKNCSIHVVPPDSNRRRNLAERAIQTFKSHIEAIIAEVDNNFPM